MKTYLAGGAVRDMILKRKANDHDYVVVGATVLELEAQGFKNIGKTFPLFLHPATAEEYAIARLEKKVGEGYYDFEYTIEGVTLEEDLKRRDLTINAMALDGKKIVDPFNGQEDLKNKILRATTDDFKDDPGRVFRLARFQATFPDFTIDEHTLLMAKNMRNDLIKLKNLYEAEGKRVFYTRLLKELLKAFQCKKPSVFIKCLDRMNVLDIAFPWIYNLKNVPQVEKYHPEGDAYTHVLMVLDNARKLTEDTLVLLGAFVHDFGKGVTPKEILPKHTNHENAGLPLVKEFHQRFQYGERNVLLTFTKQHLRIHNALEMTPKKVFKLMRKLAYKGEHFERYLLMAQADAGGKLKKEFKNLNFLREVRNTLLKVDEKQFFNEFLRKDKDKLHNYRLNMIKEIRAKY